MTTSRFAVALGLLTLCPIGAQAALKVEPDAENVVASRLRLRQQRCAQGRGCPDAAVVELDALDAAFVVGVQRRADQQAAGVARTGRAFGDAQHCVVAPALDADG